MFWAVAAKRNCLSDKLQPTQPEPIETNVAMTFKFCKERFYLFR